VEVSKEKQKGTAAETAIVTFLSKWWPNSKRLPLMGKNDEGDIDVFPWATVEVKNHARMTLAEWVDEANREGKQRKSWLNVVWHKRVRKGSPGQWYVTMDGDTFVAVLRMAETYYEITDAAAAALKEMTK
jgi:hypothetical protein